MDFNSIMAAAQTNSAKAKETKEPVLKTKLSAPKKVERKVDVAAIKKRLEEQQRRKDSLNNKSPKSSIQESKKPSSSSGTKNGAGKSIQQKQADKQRVKYEDRDHEKKHKDFMSKVQRLGSKVEHKESHRATTATVPSSRLELKPLKSNGSKMITSKGTSIPLEGKKLSSSQKPRPQINPPSFKDLIMLAEKGVSDPSALTIKKTDSVKPEPSKAKTSNNVGVVGKSESVNMKESVNKKTNDKTSQVSAQRGGRADRLENGNKVKHKQCKNEPADQQTTSSRVSHTQPVNSLKRRADDKKSMPSTAVKKPLLSESAKAKLAYRDGRRPAPCLPQRPGPSGDQPLKQQSNTKTNL